MHTVEEVLHRTLEPITPLDPQRIPIDEALGHVLAEDIDAQEDLPPFATVKVDGYAVRSADTQGASEITPVTLRVLETVPAGAIARKRVTSGTAIRVMTGAPLPQGADAVIRIEDTSDAQHTREERRKNPAKEIVIYTAAQPGENIAPAGTDVQAGDEVLIHGTILRPPEINLLAALGISHVSVYRRPRVAVIVTGDELVDLGHPLKPGKIRASNAYLLSSLIKRHGGIATMVNIIPDRIEALAEALRAALARYADLIVSTAGTSTGDHDILNEAPDLLGTVEKWEILMRPGKTLIHGNVEGIPFYGLPGPPPAAMVSFEQFVRPALLKMQGHPRLRKPTIVARLDHPVNGRPYRQYLWALVKRREDGAYAQVLNRHTGPLIAMTQANGLAVIPEGSPDLPAETEIHIQMLDWPETLAGWSS